MVYWVLPARLGESVGFCSPILVISISSTASFGSWAGAPAGVTRSPAASASWRIDAYSSLFWGVVEQARDGTAGDRVVDLKLGQTGDHQRHGHPVCREYGNARSFRKCCRSSGPIRSPGRPLCECSAVDADLIICLMASATKRTASTHEPCRRDTNGYVEADVPQHR